MIQGSIFREEDFTLLRPDDALVALDSHRRNHERLVADEVYECALHSTRSDGIPLRHRGGALAGSLSRVYEHIDVHK